MTIRMDLGEQVSGLGDELAAYEAFDALEEEHRGAVVAFLRQSTSPFSRHNPEGHITGSAVLADQGKTRLLLLWHEKLQRWLQPGGHSEEIDESPHATALRELIEETSIPRSLLRSGPDRLFDVDVHLIPSSGSTGAHFHYDLRYLFQMADEIDLDARRYRWVGLGELAAMEDASLSRLGRKLLMHRSDGRDGT